MRKMKATDKLLQKRKTVGGEMHAKPHLPKAEIYEQSMGDDELLEERRNERKRMRKRLCHRTLCILLIISCLYLTFLIYGAINTEFIYARFQCEMQQDV